MKNSPSYCTESEQAVLGAVLVRPELLAEVRTIVDQASFFREGHALIFQVMMDLADRGDPIDLVTVYALLKDRGQVEKTGGPVFLAALSEQVGFATNAPYYAYRIRNKWRARELAARGRQIIDLANQANGDLAEVLLHAESLIYEISGKEFTDTRIISEKVFLDKDFSREEQVIGNGILPKGGGLILAGESGEGKSLLRLELAIHLALGWDCWGLDIPKPRKVLTLQFENTDAIEQYRLKKMLAGLNVADCGGNLLFPTPKVRLDISEKKDQAKVIRFIEKNQADVVVYDPLTSLHRLNENDNALMRGVLDTITEINDRTGAAAVLVHHYGKPGGDNNTAHRTRGASSIRDWADTLVGVSRRKADTILRTLDFVKVRNGPEPNPILLERCKETFLHTPTVDEGLCPPEKVRKILESLGCRVEGQSELKRKIIAEVNCGEVRARHLIHQAIARGEIDSEPHPTDSRKRIYFVSK